MHTCRVRVRCARDPCAGSFVRRRSNGYVLADQPDARRNGRRGPRLQPSGLRPTYHAGLRRRPGRVQFCFLHSHHAGQRSMRRIRSPAQRDQDLRALTGISQGISGRQGRLPVAVQARRRIPAVAELYAHPSDQGWRRTRFSRADHHADATRREPRTVAGHSRRLGRPQHDGRLDVARFAFKGTWVEAYERLTYGFNGTYSITLTKLSDGTQLLSYTNHSIDLWRNG